jgi:hypothetical protein
MTLSCGVNDVWHGKRGVELPDYRKNIAAIVDQAQAAGIKVMILTSTMIKEDQANDLNQKLAGYNAALKEIAADKKCLLADLNTEMQEALKTFPPDATKGKQLTTDGVHMNPYGNMMMARGVLKAFGVATDKVTALEADWRSIPGTKSLRLTLGLSLAEYELLTEKAGDDLRGLFNKVLQEKKTELLQTK